ncbi:MAG: radical SAM protein [Ectobacillus sp.]
MNQYFKFDGRLGIEVPYLKQDWEDIPSAEQHGILLKWEEIRGKIPDRIKSLEALINEKQHQLNHEGNFHVSCILNSEIAELASIINDLWIWYRINQDISAEKAHS